MPRYFVLFYAAMALLPIVLLALLISVALAHGAYAYYIIQVLALDLLVYAVLGYAEAFTGRRAVNRMGAEDRRTRHAAQAAGDGIVLQVQRFDGASKSMKTAEYTVRADNYTTVLDALLSVKQEQDSSLSMRYSCRMGVCGSCGVVINGKPALACETNARACCKDNKVSVGPMLAHPLVKDLVDDFDDFFEKHISVQPGIVAESQAARLSPARPLVQRHEQLEKFLPYSYCIMCGLCLDACPVVNTNAEFVGPQALSQAYRYLKDSRDKKGDERIKIIDKLTGLWGCEYAGACSEVCPKGVDPASAIQLLKAEAAKSYLEFKNVSE